MVQKNKRNWTFLLPSLNDILRMRVSATAKLADALEQWAKDDASDVFSRQT